MKPYFISVVTLLLTACTPTVNLAPPEQPIEINLNVKIDHQISINVDQKTSALIVPSEVKKEASEVSDLVETNTH
ncbi:YnbE family lipoprotein [Shewanella intestini]|uniref:YnbE family lipoprotein n=1 Tax=Shewanella intestini TaxID=2017544 RepID=A0ABS5I1A7_9GAMM|nr:MULTISPECIES: YnbE family lipoprotein [Shewanella]MBR9727800.1 YnbE family lipoprotein [Shewanella intestini]MRG36207.1 YnbE family lipoprotein [Shewanella sp. XMDDZSB0408]